MNQILITEKLYITPELKRKKKIYKFNFFLSVFFVCILVSLCIYAEYDRNKSEEVSQEIMSEFNIETIQEDTTIAKNNILIVVLDESEEVEEITDEDGYLDLTPTNNSTQNQQTVQSTSQGYKYTTIATINIPKINVQYPILDGDTDSEQETEALLKIAPTKFW